MKFLKLLIILLSSVAFISCKVTTKEKADLLVINAKAYAVDSVFSSFEAMAIKEGKIISTGSSKEILEKYSAKDTLDAKGKFIFPGFIDAHCHFYNYGVGLQEVELTGTKSWREVLSKVSTYAAQSKNEWIIGRGWDQNDWDNKEFPTKLLLDSLFQNRPVMLTRVDGHAVIANSEALKRADFSIHTKISGGEIEIKNNQLTGILVDNACNKLQAAIPSTGEEKMRNALLEAQKNCFAVGLTTVDDAGLEKEVIDLIQKMYQEGTLKMRIYAMLSDNKKNEEAYLTKRPFKTDRLNVRGWKIYADGALGSRGACLMHPYSDKKETQGFLLNTPAYFAEQASKLAKNGWQMNTHCIGDSSNRLIVNLISNYIPEIGLDHRWRIEHSQVVSAEDLIKYGALQIIPSIQPTHATSDMYWLKDRLGNERAKTAYAYKDLLKAVGKVALGTDFPVESIDPLNTFFAAVFRKDKTGFPEKGFQMENALTREETIKGMTIWAAFANFEEREKGSLEKGKFADFILLDTDLMTCPENAVLKTQVLKTYVNGEQVYSK